MEELTFDESIEIFKSILNAKRSLNLIFKGTSMLPTIESGKYIQIDKIAIPKIGDIYLFIVKTQYSFDKLVCHRLVKIIDSKYYFKGDNRLILDDPVNLGDIIGKVVSWH